jgi:S-formylglutathione hydrolase
MQDKQLLPEVFEAANNKEKIDLVNRLQADYDHSYFFVSTFMEDHIRFHASHLGLQCQ